MIDLLQISTKQVIESREEESLTYVNHEAYQNYRRATAMSLRSSEIPSAANIIKEITSTPN